MRARVPPARMCLVAAMAIATALLLYAGRGQAFYLDEWDLLLNRRGWTVDTFLRSHNEHLFLVPILVLKSLVALVGLTPHWVFQIPVLATHLLTVVLLFTLVARRLGDWLGLAAALLVLFLGSAWEDLLLPIQVSFVGSVAAGLAMLLVLDGPPSRRRDVLCAALLLIAICCSGVGTSFVVVALVEILASPRARQRVWIALVPALLYGVWYLAYGQRMLEGGGSVTSNAPSVPAYVADEAAGVLGAISGLGLEWGRLLALVALVLLVRRVLAPHGLSVRVTSLVAGLATFWVETALARAHLHEPGATRYVYVGAVYVILVTVEASRPVALSRRAGALVALGVAFAMVANVNLLRGGRDTLRELSAEISARLSALEIVGPEAVAADFQPAPELTPRIRAGPYFDAVADLGSPATDPKALPSQSRQARDAADEVLIRAVVRASRRSSAAEPVGRLELERVGGGRAKFTNGCIELRATSGDAVLLVIARGEGLVVEASADAPVRVTVARFGEFTRPVAEVAPVKPVVVDLPRGHSDVPWRARVETAGTAEICSVTAAESS